MFGVPDYGAFVAAVILFLCVPGPGNLALITATGQSGRRAGMAASLGLICGDQVLMWVGRALQQHFRPGDLIARYGGDEFVILMPETNIEQSRQLASKLRSWISADPLLREKNITAS